MFNVINSRALFFVLAIVWHTEIHAEVAPKQSDAAQQALKKAQGVLRQLGEEKAVLESEKNALIQEKTALQEQLKKLESMIKQLEPLKTEVATQKAYADSLRNSNNALSSQLNHAHENERRLKETQQEIITQAKLIQSDNQQLVAMVQEREKWITSCNEKNRNVVTAANELAEKYQNKSLWTKLSEDEPFTGIGNVESQNTLQTYQFKLDDLKVTAFESESKTPH